MKKFISTLALAAVLAMGSSAAFADSGSGGILVSDLTGKDSGGILVSDLTEKDSGGILVSDFIGTLVSGLAGILVSD